MTGVSLNTVIVVVISASYLSYNTLAFVQTALNDPGQQSERLKAADFRVALRMDFGALRGSSDVVTA